MLRLIMSPSAPGRPAWRSAPAAFFAVAAVLAAAAALIHGYDLPFKEWLGQYRCHANHPILHPLLRLIRPFGKAETMVFIALGLAAAGGRRAGWRIALALALAGLLVTPVKLAVGRQRPNGSDHKSFPSGDSATAAAVVAPLAASSAAAGAPALAAAPVVAALRIYDNAHYLSDALAGLAFGMLAGALALCCRPDRWRFVRLPGPRWFLPAAIAMGVGIYCGGIPKDKGKFHDFMQFFGPLAIYLATMAYWRVLFIADPSRRLGLALAPARRFAEGLRRRVLDRLPPGLTVFTAMAATVAVAVLAAWIWTWDTERIKLPAAGLALLAGAAALALCLDMLFGQTRRAAARGVVAAAIWLLALILFLLPSLLVWLLRGG